MRKSLRSIFVGLFLVVFFTGDLFAGGSLLIRNARLFDGATAQIQEGMSILILDGRIVRIGKSLPGQGTPELDVAGCFVLPGLVDSHIHLKWGPGAALDGHGLPPNVMVWRATWGKHLSDYLRAYLACGVTTVVDASAPPFVIQEVRREIEKGTPSPRFLTLGEFFSPPKGYGVDGINPPVSTPSEANIKLEAMMALGVTGIKVPIEKGWSAIGKLPEHSPDVLKAIKEGAVRHKLPIFVHATCEEDFNKALNLGARALMHTLSFRGKARLSRTFIERMAHAGTYQVSTLSIMDTELAQYQPDRLNEPLLEVVVPKNELAKAKDPTAAVKGHKMYVRKQMPSFFSMFSGVYANRFYSEGHIAESLRNSQKAIRDLHDAGVPIVMGSDTVNNWVTPYQFHGFTSLRELELLGEAGLSTSEVIKAATVNGAKMIGLDREIGTVEIGKWADLVVLQDNPLVNLRAFRTIRWTIRDGTAKTPREWMAQERNANDRP